MSPMNTVPANPHHNRRPLYLVADIGGTNARFAFVERDNPLPQPIANYAVEDFPSFDGVLDQLEADWLQLQQQDAVLEGACLAVAAIPEQREISFTNNAWRFTAASVATRLSCEQISIINDFAAVARALPALTADHLEAIGGGEAAPHKPMVAIGPGTGTGVASVVFDQAGTPIVLPGEGGHVDAEDFVSDGAVALCCHEHADRQGRVHFAEGVDEVLNGGHGIVGSYRWCGVRIFAKR